MGKRGQRKRAREEEEEREGMFPEAEIQKQEINRLIFALVHQISMKEKENVFICF